MDVDGHRYNCFKYTRPKEEEDACLAAKRRNEFDALEILKNIDGENLTTRILELTWLQQP